MQASYEMGLVNTREMFQVREVGSQIPGALHLDLGKFDPRKYLAAARKELTEVIKHKNASVLESANRV
jgi:hypothetical protein